MAERLQYDHSFPEAVERVFDVVSTAITDSWDTIAALNELPDCVYLKNLDGVIVHGNEAYSRHFSPEHSPIGRSGQSFLEQPLATVSKHTDQLIIGGSPSLEIEHSGRAAEGTLYALRTHKRNLTPLGNVGFAILGVTRLESVIEEKEDGVPHSLADRYRVYKSLSETDREIARLIGLGVTGREIGEQLNMTSRTVEMRKKKLLDALGLDQTVDLVKLLVRLEDGGYLDLGL